MSRNTNTNVFAGLAALVGGAAAKLFGGKLDDMALAFEDVLDDDWGLAATAHLDEQLSRQLALAA